MSAARPLRIGLNSQKLLASHTGVGNYTYYLVKNLLAVDDTNRYCLFFFNQFRDGRELLSCSLTPVEVDDSGFGTTRNTLRILWEQLVLPGKVRESEIDVFHYIDHTLSLVSKPCPTVITVHDLAFFRLPEMYNASRRLYKRFVSRRSIARANRIITISDFTRREILSLSDADESRIEVIPYGIDSQFRPIDPGMELETTRAEYGLPERFVLFVGTLQPRKNLDGLIRAFDGARRKHGFQHKLVICGDRGWLYKEIFGLIEKLGLIDAVQYMDFVPHRRLPAIYNLADLFVYPSWFEGFGLPPLEAMACGTPVVCSNVTSIPEVVGDAGILVDPADTDGLADAIGRVLTDPALARTMRAAGIERARRFSWENNARRTVEVYRKAAEEGR